jgi:hypothetical protein
MKVFVQDINSEEDLEFFLYLCKFFKVKTKEPKKYKNKWYVIYYG